MQSTLACELGLDIVVHMVHNLIMATGNHREATMASKSETGTCSVCERVCKCRGGRIVAHGYRRPAYGSGNVGPCTGTGALPLHVSIEGAERYRDSVEETISQLQEQMVAKPGTRIRWALETTRNELRRIQDVIARWTAWQARHSMEVQ